jgi:hypothetical protein
MPADDKKPGMLPAIFSLKCPNCRSSVVFKNKDIFPLRELVVLKERCDLCGQVLQSERNNGGGINYALTCMLFILNLAWYWPIFGITYTDNSMYYFLVVSTLVVILVQPFLMRLSRVIYLYLWVGFKSS